MALGLRAAGDADAAAARLLLWLRETSRPWLIVLDDVVAPAVMDGLWPHGPATSLNLANAYHSVGRLTDAARLLEDTARLCEQELPDSDSLTQAAREALAAMTGTG